MRRRFTNTSFLTPVIGISVATLIAAVATGGDDAKRSKTELPPKSPASIELSANPLFIRCDGSQSSTLSAQVRDGKGKDVPNGTLVTFFNPYGSAEPSEAQTRKGRAETDVRIFAGEFPPQFADIYVQAGDLRASFAVRCVLPPVCAPSPPMERSLAARTRTSRTQAPTTRTPTPPLSASPPCVDPPPTPNPCWPLSPPNPGDGCPPPCAPSPPQHPLSPPCETPTPEPCWPVSPPAQSPPCVTPTPQPTCVPNGHELSPPECPTPCDDDDPNAPPCPPRPRSLLTIDATCDISSPIVEATCRVTPGTTIEVGFVVTNRTAAPVGIASFQFALINDSRALLEPLPGADNNVNGNPDFEEASFPSPDTWTCAIPSPKPDNGEGGPERTVSWMGCLTVGGEQAVVQPGERLLLARIRYQVSPDAEGEAQLELADVFIGDEFASTVGFCTAVDDFACDGATIIIRGATPTPVIITPEPTTSLPLIPGEQRPGGGLIATPMPERRRSLN